MNKEKKKPEKKIKPLTAAEMLNSQPKAMQVGPQYHLRKGWPHNVNSVIRGGL